MFGCWPIIGRNDRHLDRCRVEMSLGKMIERNSPAGARSPARASRQVERTSAILSVPAGSYLPNWTIDLSLEGDDPFAAAASAKVAYWWMACLSISTIVVLAFGLAMYLRRQMSLTRLKNDLIATVSHELKTPLSAMRVLNDTLIDGKLPNEKDRRDYLQLIARENLRLSRLIDNFLTFSRMECNKAAFEFRPLRVQVLSMRHWSVRERGTRKSFLAAAIDGARRCRCAGDAIGEFIG